MKKTEKKEVQTTVTLETVKELLLDPINDPHGDGGIIYNALRMLTLEDFLQIIMKHSTKLEPMAYNIFKAEQEFLKLLLLFSANSKNLKVHCTMDNQVLLLTGDRVLAEFESIEKFYDFYMEVDESITPNSQD